MKYQPKKYDNLIANELNLLREELKATKLIPESEIKLSTLLVYSAMKSKVNNPETICNSFFLTYASVNRELSKLAPVNKRVLNTYRKRKSTLKLDTIEIKLIMLPENILITESPQSPQSPQSTIAPQIVIPKHQHPTDKKSKLKNLQM